MNTQDWNGCYDGSWQSAPLVAEAYAHPAKVSFNLAERIYRHMLAEGWLAPGDLVLDPFGGIGGFAFHAALYGMHWTGVELEQRFVDLGNQNLELWHNRYAPHFPAYGTARLLQGDSRRLVEVVTAIDGVITSPVYLDARQDTTKGGGENIRYGDTPGNLCNMPTGDSRRLVEVVAGAGGIVSSPPYSETQINPGNAGGAMTKRDKERGRIGGDSFTSHDADGYGTTPGNLGNMPAGSAVTGAGGVVSSPPYTSALSAQTDGIDWTKGKGGRDFSVEPGQEIRLHMGKHYGTTPGQLGAMPAGVVSSPPFESSNGRERPLDITRAQKNRHLISLPYGTMPNNIGNDTADTFWSAAATIVQQCYAILRPGGYAAWVTGDFVRARRRVPFGQQWLDLCVSCGFEPVLWAVAWKSEHNGTQVGMFGEAQELRKEKVSFFRRLANQKNPDAAIANEDVIFVMKPL